jgi:AcrR family transcriptional regulator
MASARAAVRNHLKSQDKPATRGRPQSIDSAALLAVAREVFLERGIRATTLEVAERAGVSEGVLFHRFKSKEALFSAAMNFDRDEAPQILMRAIRELEALELREALVKLCTTLLDIGRIALPIMMMSWSNPQLSGATPFDKKRAQFREVLKEFASYFERRMEEGKLRSMDAEVLARAFLGSVHHYCLTRLLMDPSEPIVPEGMFVRELVDLLLNGCVPMDERQSMPSPRRVPGLKPRAGRD